METPASSGDRTQAETPVTTAVLRTLAAMVALAVAALVFASPASAQQQARPSDIAVAEAEFVVLLNQERAKVGQGPLQVHPNLVRDARAWSAVMAPTSSIFHTKHLGAETANSLPNWQRAGENVGRGWDVGGLHRAFVASPPHYATMIGDFDYVGFGVVYTADRTYVTARFAKLRPGSAPTPMVNPAVASGQVRRLYLAFFKREPDAGGSNFWVPKVSAGFPLGQISDEFIKSAEFRATYGHLTDGQFITMVYQNVLGRAPDGAGYAYWVERMRQGMNRGSVMTNFSESAEFKANTA